MISRILLVSVALAAACGSAPGWPPAPIAGEVNRPAIWREHPADSASTPGAAAGDVGPAALVAQGRRWWRESPDPRNPVACATCHHEPAEARGWAASFPKVKPMPPPHTRVMTLLQANAEAVRRHYGLADPLPAATAITAYLAWEGAGAPLSPGVSSGQPIFPDRMRALTASVVSGGRLYAERCSRCHAEARVAPAVALFPRVIEGRAEALEVFLQDHRIHGQPLPWDGTAMADLIAYLASRIAGRPIGLHLRQTSKEGS
jgi:mono/diheme cytochrome c family protein